MSDNEIIKAVNLCANLKCSDDCDKCPAKTMCDSDIERFIVEVAQLINRQKAEIERLEEEICIQHKIIDERGAEVLRHDRCIRILHEKLETAKAEAVKEFAKRLKSEMGNCARIDFNGTYYAIGYRLIDNLEKDLRGRSR